MVDLRRYGRMLPLLLLGGTLAAATNPEMAATLSPEFDSPESDAALALQREDLAFPEELTAESAIYLQRRLGEWTEVEARRLLGTPRRHREASEQGVVTGDIYAFADPTGRYREFELLFPHGNGRLSAVLIYPWHMSWEDCLALWGEDVDTSEMAGGGSLRVYRERRLDVVVDARGNVVSLQVY